MALPDINYEELDPGIRQVVRLLRTNGFDTCDSGDGKAKVAAMECALAFPHVAMKCGRASLIEEADRLYSLLRALNLRDFTIQATYDPAPGMPSVLMVMDLDDQMLAAANPLRPN